MHIPLVDLKAQYKNIKEEIDIAISRILEKTNFIMGKEIEEFESLFAKFIGTEYAIGVSSGTDAIHLSLKVLGVKKGDEVILPAHTFTATAEPIVWLGAKPVFVDIDEKTYTLDPNHIAKRISGKTKVIIPVHLYGHPADMSKIMEIAKKYNLYVLEDAAQAHGAQIKITQSANNPITQWRKVGSIGDLGIFSFYPGKNLGAFGDAGMVVTSSKRIADNIKLLRNHGRLEKYSHKVVGFGDRLDTIQASILQTKLRHLKMWNIERQMKAKIYKKYLEGLKTLKLPFIAPWARSVYHLFVIKAKRRNALRKYLKSKGIETGIHYPVPLHLQPAYRFLGYKKGELPVTEKVVDQILSLPLYPEMSEKHISYISQCIRDFYS